MRWRSDLAMMPDLVAALPPGTEVLDYSTPAPATAASCAVVAVPARNEEAVVGRCLRCAGGSGPTGSRWPCCSTTARTARRRLRCRPPRAAACASPLLNVRLPAEAAHAGWARRLAMDLAAGLLLERGEPDAVILTTDADCAPLPGWLDASLAGLEAGADIVAGAIEPVPDEFPLLNEACRLRADLVRDYIYLLDRLATLIDPEPHDPWPRHPFRCGASLALRLRHLSRRSAACRRCRRARTRRWSAAVLRQGGRVRHAVQARVAHLLPDAGPGPRRDGRHAGALERRGAAQPRLGRGRRGDLGGPDTGAAGAPARGPCRAASRHRRPWRNGWVSHGSS